MLCLGNIPELGGEAVGKGHPGILKMFMFGMISTVFGL